MAVSDAPASSDNETILETTHAYFDATAARLGLDPGARQDLRTPKRSLIVSIPLLRDDGTVEILDGYRVQHSIIRGPAKGGIRFDLSTKLDTIRAFAMIMTWKTALAGIPFGGACGGIAVDPQILSANEIEHMTRRYATEISVFLGPESDIPGPDLHTGEREMAWIMDTYSMHVGYSVPAVVTGKPVAIGGSVGRQNALGRGCVQVLHALESERLIETPVKGARVAVAGYGQVGSSIARFLRAAGAHIVALSDSTAGIQTDAKDSLDLDLILRFKAEYGSVSGVPGTTTVEKEAILAADCDILVLAAEEHMLTSTNINVVRAATIVEGGNGMVSAGADAALHERGSVVVPDIFANAGGIIGSYFEWVQDLQEHFWTEAEETERLNLLMGQAITAVLDRQRRDNLSLREAAMDIAVARVAEASRVRGLWP